MEKRERIIRILAALRAKFADGSGCTEAEAAEAMIKYHELMIQYNLQESDIHVKQEGVGKQYYHRPDSGKQKPDYYYALSTIGKLSDTRIIWGLKTGRCHIYGTQADRDYAEFLIRVVVTTVETSWKAYRYSWEYTKLIDEGEHGRHIRNTFRKAVVLRLVQRMRELIAKNKPTGTGLIVLKQELINAFLAEEGSKAHKGTSLSLKTGLHSTVQHAFDAANKAHLQHQTTDEAQKLIGRG